MNGDKTRPECHDVFNRLPGEFEQQSMPWQLVVVALMGMTAFGCRNRLDAVKHPETGYAFPHPDEIASIDIGNRGLVMEFDDFQAPPSHWPRILAALSPSQHDPQPCGWQGLALLEIRTKDGKVYKVDVFWLDDEPVGAFDVDAGPSHRGGYYRGGNSRRLVEAITAAAKDAEQ
jgi:hypothetical protein